MTYIDPVSAIPRRPTPLVAPGMPGIPFTGYPGAGATATSDLAAQVAGISSGTGRPRRTTPLQATRIPQSVIPPSTRASRPIIPNRAPVQGPWISNTPVTIRNAGMAQVDDLARQLAGGGGPMARASNAARGLFSGGLTIPKDFKSIKGSIVPGLAIGVGGNYVGEQLGGDESFLGRVVKGASSGAALGLAFGKPGAVIGGLGGATLAALGIGGDDDDGTKWLEDDVLDRAGFTDEDKGQIRLTFDILKDTVGEDQAKQQIGQLIMQDIQMREAAAIQTEQEQARMLSTQALAAQFFQPFTQQMFDSAQQRYAATEAVADQLPPEFRAIARANNAASLDNANRVATAYQAQAQLLPAMAAMDYQMNLANQLSQQQAAQVMANLGFTGGGGGATSLTDLASQLALQNQGG